MIALASIVIAAAIYVAFAFASSRKREEFVTSERAPLYYSAIHIICGDCSGDEAIPVKTFMNRHGECASCGGSSYILASHRGAYLRGLMAGLNMQQSAMNQIGDGRVVPFEPRQRPAAQEQEKIAV